MTTNKDIDPLEKKSIIRCIYCGKSVNEGIELNVSDIFPISLSNFGATFESDVINSLARIRNHLNIKSHGNKYPAYTVTHTVDDRKITKEGDVLRKGIVKSKDGKSLFGPIEELEKMAGFTKKN